MEFRKTKLKGVYIIEPESYGDNRGWFMETYSKGEFSLKGLNYDFVQDNQSFSLQKGIIRGLHFQKNPMAQAKLVRCTQGAILDIAVDIRKGSDTYLQYVAVELSSQNKKQLMIPRGFAHGFATLTENVMVQYKVDNLYSKDHDRSIKYNDPSIGIDWKVKKPILSQKDTICPLLADSDADFTIKVLVTGYKGQLGYDVIKKLQQEGYECKGVDIEDFDITNYGQVNRYIKAYDPDVVVHCSAYTAVDKAEEFTEMCSRVNVLGSENIARACKEIDAKMVYISTDYVFSGSGEEAYEVNSPKAPLSIYGITKLNGELRCKAILDKLFIIRTSWVFGVNGSNFVKTMLNLAKSRDSINVVCDQVGSPTYTPDLADFIFYIINTDKYGEYHCTNEEYCSWYEFAKRIFEMRGIPINLQPVATKDYKTAAIRPLNSRLSKKSLLDAGYKKMPTWKNALERYLIELEEKER